MYDGMEAVISQWDRLIAITGYHGTVYGIQEDGTLLQHTRNLGNTELADMKNLEWVQTLTDPHAIDNAEALVGKTKDGRILGYGSNTWLEMLSWEPLSREPVYQDLSAIREFVSQDIMLTVDGRAFGSLFVNARKGQGTQKIQVEVGTGLTQVELVENTIHVAEDGTLIHTYVYAGLTGEGRVTVWDRIDEPYQSELPWLQEELERVRKAEAWQDVAQLVSDGWYLYGVHKDGTVSTTRDSSDLKPASDVKKVAARCDDVLALHNDGTVEMLAATDNAVRQGKAQVDGWSGIQDIAMGESHCVGLRSDGTVTAVGSNHCGQCEVEDWTDIVFLTAGKNITLGITKSGELKIAGELY